MKLETQLKYGDLFDSLEREKEQEIRKIKVYKDRISSIIKYSFHISSTLITETLAIFLA